ncbi:hypothetical protein QR90_15340 [Deinococcus radiopugnans]|uniref:Lipoprotein n=1 Tax=Deinococcus radiopugnans TaxID=57497 RepID=A0A0A7KJ67_9DEIO|nr:hypothetical protein [Deinococcus radiopugnans]AIZ46135.1 hypothetical protein QR90_15340 [Deinococcus radiopugnans]
MKRLNLIALSGLGLLLASCSAGSPALPDGGRPPLPTGVEVRFPAAPANAYLSLLTEDGQSVYQLSVPAGATRSEVDPDGWKAEEKNAQDVALVLPAGSVTDGAKSNIGDAQVCFLRWAMWRDGNTNGKRDDGETLNLMTHDRVAYASQPFTVVFKTATPDMQQTWKLKAGWSRAEHYVYLPQGTSTYLRSLESDPVQRYTLHVETPVTSQ